MKDRFKAAIKISWIMIIANFLLAGIKISVGFLAGSAGLIADGFHSVSDIITTVVVLIAVNIARKPPDEVHNYGHGQAEPIAAKILGLFLIFTGFLLTYNTIVQLINRQYQVLGLAAFWVAILSILAKEIMFRYSFKIGKETNNQSLIADAYHHRSDSLSSIAAAAGVLASNLGYPVFDPVAALIVSFFIIRAGWLILRDALNSLLLNSPDKEKIKKIKKIVESVHGVEEVADLKAHYSGADLYIDLKILVDYSITVLEGHQIAANVKKTLFNNIPETAEVLIHVDPMMIYNE